MKRSAITAVAVLALLAFAAAYAVGEWSPTAWLRLSGGARLDAFSTFDPTVNPRAAVILRPWAGGVFKVMGGRSFRAPSTQPRSSPQMTDSSSSRSSVEAEYDV